MCGAIEEGKKLIQDAEGEVSKVGDCRDDEDDGDGSLGEASEAGEGDLDGGGAGAG